jgi:hypothetical protein
VPSQRRRNKQRPSTDFLSTNMCGHEKDSPADSDLKPSVGELFNFSVSMACATRGLDKETNVEAKFVVRTRPYCFDPRATYEVHKPDAVPLICVLCTTNRLVTGTRSLQCSFSMPRWILRGL